MVVEDEPDIYDVLLAMFEIWGIEGVAFVDGAEAVAWIDDVDQGRVRGELPELAILDIRLPEVSGPEVGNRLRRSPVLGDIAIVLITAYRLKPEEEQAVIAEAQADLLMYKPLPAMAELRATMDAVIAKHKKPEAPALNVRSAEIVTPARSLDRTPHAGPPKGPRINRPPAPPTPDRPGLADRKRQTD
jgi:CheY-like chemotaxis protein